MSAQDNIPPPLPLISPQGTVPASDIQCQYQPCGAPTTISNINLEKAVGGKPGFFNISRHMCVGNSIDSGYFGTVQGGDNPQGRTLGKTVLRDDDPGVPRSNYPYACGYFDYSRNVTANGSALWEGGQAGCSQWFDFFCHVFYGCFKDNPAGWKRNNVSETMTTTYLTNPDQPRRKRTRGIGNPFNSQRYRIKFQEITPIIKRVNRISNPNHPGDLKVHSIIRHPRMNREELRFFGVNENEFDNVLVAAPGSTVNINFGCMHSEALTVSVAFFKWDLSTVVEHTGRVVIDGRERDTFNILSEKTIDGDTHPTSVFMKYLLYSGWFRNGANKGNTGQTANATVTLPLEPFFDDNTIMVVFVGNKFPSLGRYSNSRRDHRANITNSNWNTQGGFKTTGLPWSQYGGGDYVLCGCNFSISVPEYLEESVGCSQTRNVDWSLYPDGQNYRQKKPVDGSEPDQLWRSPSQGSHIMKIVSNDYYERDCTIRMSPNIADSLDASQNSVIYTSNCFEDVGDPYLNNTSLEAAESALGMYFIEKCASYSMNISPNAEISNVSRCCLPKISGPFIKEFTPYGETNTMFRADALHDGPDIQSNYRPNLNYYSKNLSYILENRIDCECDDPECKRSKCYSCPSNTKMEYDACLQSPECAGNPDLSSCCVNPCIGAPLDYVECVAADGGSYDRKGCCQQCYDCVADNISEYQQCLNNQGVFASRRCKDRNCCSINCSGCPEDIIACSQIDICSRSNCCKFNCDASCDLKDEYGSSGHPTLRALRNAAEAQNPGSGIDIYPPVYVNKSLTDYWNCITRKNNYDLYPKNECGENCCCVNPCDKYRAEGLLAKSTPDGQLRSWLRSECLLDPTCNAEGCAPFIPRGG